MSGGAEFTCLWLHQPAVCVGNLWEIHINLRAACQRAMPQFWKYFAETDPSVWSVGCRQGWRLHQLSPGSFAHVPIQPAFEQNHQTYILSPSLACTVNAKSWCLVSHVHACGAFFAVWSGIFAGRLVLIWNFHLIFLT